MNAESKPQKSFFANLCIVVLVFINILLLLMVLANQAAIESLRTSLEAMKLEKSNNSGLFSSGNEDIMLFVQNGFDNIQKDIKDSRKEIESRLKSVQVIERISPESTVDLSNGSDERIIEIQNKIDSLSISQAKTVSDLQAQIARLQKTIENNTISQPTQFQRTLENTSTSQLSQLQKAIENSTATQLSEIKNTINNAVANASKFSNDEKRDAYLALARQNLDNPDVAQIIYASALAYSTEKSPILFEIIKWQRGLIEEDVNLNKEEQAQERFANLVRFCDEGINVGAIEDFKSISRIKEQLLSIDMLISESIENKIREQKKELSSYEDRIKEIKTFDQAEELLLTVTNMECDPSIEDLKRTIITNTLMKEACITTPNQELIIPEINDDTPWIAWINNFIVRLNSNAISVTKKMEDIGSASDFIAEAYNQSNIESISETLKRFENALKRVLLTYWEEQSDQIRHNETIDKEQIASLLADSSSFDRSLFYTQDEYRQFEQTVVELNRLLLMETRDNLNSNLTHLKKIQGHIPPDAYMQLIGMIQNQYLQFLFSLSEIDQKYPNQFNLIIDEVLEKVKSFDDLISSNRATLTKMALEDEKSKVDKFVEYAEGSIRRAQEYYDLGEKKAGELFATTKNEEAQRNYRYAWQTLIEIYPSDLQSANPALYQKYSELKDKIEKRFKPSDWMIQNVEYTQISDF